MLNSLKRSLFLIAFAVPFCIEGLAAGLPDPDPTYPQPEELTTVRDEVGEMHRNFVDEFVEAEGFGVRRITHLAPAPYEFTIGDQRYRVESRALMSLLKAEEPVVYVEPPNTPGAIMNFLAPFGGRTHARETRNEPHAIRPLSEFETRALSRLRDGRDVVVKFGPGGSWAVGAISARTDCIRCHGGNEGDLLGAFVYQLQPIVATDPAASELTTKE